MVDVTFLSYSINKLIDVFPINMCEHTHTHTPKNALKLLIRCGDPYGSVFSFSHDFANVVS